jgi:hypothetical protein
MSNSEIGVGFALRVRSEMAVKGNGKFNNDPVVLFTAQRNEVAELAKGWASASIHKTYDRKTPSRGL